MLKNRKNLKHIGNTREKDSKAFLDDGVLEKYGEGRAGIGG